MLLACPRAFRYKPLPECFCALRYNLLVECPAFGGMYRNGQITQGTIVYRGARLTQRPDCNHTIFVIDKAGALQLGQRAMHMLVIIIVSAAVFTQGCWRDKA